MDLFRITGYGANPLIKVGCPAQRRTIPRIDTYNLSVAIPRLDCGLKSPRFGPKDCSKASEGATEMSSQSFPDQVVGYSDRLRAYACKLGANSSFSDDLVQETVLRALLHADQFRLGTNLGAWLHTILRHCYFNERRSQRRLVVDDAVNDRAMAAEQMWSIELQDMEKLMAALPAAQREALTLVAVEGLSYDAAAFRAGFRERDLL
jgi:RNA polymerase sigma factor (sigma-70 family)